MFLWFVATAIVSVWFVFRDPRFDYRLLIVGSVLPLADGRDGWGVRAAHVGVQPARAGRRDAGHDRPPADAQAAARAAHRDAAAPRSSTACGTTPTCSGGRSAGSGFDGAPLPEVARGGGTCCSSWSGWPCWCGCGGRRGCRTRRPGGSSWTTAGCSPGRRERCGTLSTVLILVRHGRTALNAQGRLQGRVDEPLDEVGLAQAMAVAEPGRRRRRADLQPAASGPQQTARGVRRAVHRRRALDRAVVRHLRGRAARRRAVGGVGPVAGRPGVRARGRRVAGRARQPGPRGVRRARRAGRGADGRRRVSHVSPIKSAVAWALGAASRSLGARTCRTRRSAASTSAAAAPSSTVQRGRPMSRRTDWAPVGRVRTGRGPGGCGRTPSRRGG